MNSFNGMNRHNRGLRLAIGALLVVGALSESRTTFAASLVPVSAFQWATMAQVNHMVAQNNGVASGTTVNYTGKVARIVVAAVLPGFPFPSFEVAHVKDPTLTVAGGSDVKITFINTNAGFGHSFQITQKAPPFAVMPQIVPVVAGTQVSPIPKGGKFPYATFSWHPEAGTYYYVCTVPGHAMMGMFGKIIVK